MNIGVIGGGILGLTLSLRLSQQGHGVEIFESASQIGGLACPQDYGTFVWDKFYHCILPQDQHLLDLIEDLGLKEDLRWTRTKTGYYAGNRFYSMSNNVEFLRFPLLSFIDKARLSVCVILAKYFSDPLKLYKISAKEWLTNICGKKAYEVFWQPLLKAKFGIYHDQVAAVFIWATLTRLFGARKGGKEMLGYVSGGYNQILRRFKSVLERQHVLIHLDSPVLEIAMDTTGDQKGCLLTLNSPTGVICKKRFDQVFFTAPTPVAKRVVSSEFLPYVKEIESDYPTAQAYLGVLCVTLVLKRPLTDFYILNIGENTIPLTGLIEMTNLIDPSVETHRQSLVFLPLYVDSEDPLFGASDDEISQHFISKGLKHLFPEFHEEEILYCGVHRARYVQPLPLIRNENVEQRGIPELNRPFHILNTSMLQCATLNNNEVVGMVNDFLKIYEKAKKTRFTHRRMA